MDYVRLGRTGLKVSRLCLGCMTYGDPGWRRWVLDEAASRPFFVEAWEAGINFFDTADMYSVGVSEEVTGRILKELAPRDSVVIATKVFNRMSDEPNDQGLSRKHIMAGVDNSLRRLGTDYIDLYQIHRFDPETPIEETMEALHDCVKAGKVRYIGASSMWARQFIAMQHTAEINGWTRFVSMQNYYNAVYREEEREVIPFCVETGVGLIPWSPMARGFLTRRHADRTLGDTARADSDEFAKALYGRDEDYAVADAVAKVADARGVPMAQVALAWVLANPAITSPIIGASKPGHLKDALAALDLKLSPEEMKAIATPYAPSRVKGHR
ncbi:MAG: aldo/keto reductase [Pseudomonadota bacterium]|nr:aldo/keto reductase [Pseudomonadota bacterium]